VEARKPDPSILQRLRHSKLQQLYAYWDGKRAGRAMPRRSDIDPLEIKNLLPLILIVERVGLRAFRYRLVGTSIVDASGVEITGTLERISARLNRGGFPRTAGCDSSCWLEVEASTNAETLFARLA
jgi:hypothetical protein